MRRQARRRPPGRLPVRSARRFAACVGASPEEPGHVRDRARVVEITLAGVGAKLVEHLRSLSQSTAELSDARVVGFVNAGM